MSDLQTFKKHTHDRVEASRVKGQPWRLSIDGPTGDLTPAQARTLAQELVEAADSAAHSNRPETPSLEGRELLLIKHGLSDGLSVFADGKPKRLLRMTHNHDNEVHLFAISDTWCKPGNENHTVRQGKDRSVTYELVGYFELILEGNKTDGHALVGRVDS